MPMADLKKVTLPPPPPNGTKCQFFKFRDPPPPPKQKCPLTPPPPPPPSLEIQTLSTVILLKDNCTSAKFALQVVMCCVT